MPAPARTRSGGFLSTTRSSSSLLRRSASPTRFYLSSTTAAAAVSVRFSSPSPAKPTPATRNRVCSCSPTTHPGSFRCAMHRQIERQQQQQRQQNGSTGDGASRLSARRSAMVNSLVRIGAVEGGQLIRRSLAALIRPSLNQQRRRASFQLRPSRLSLMSSAGPDPDLISRHDG